MLDLWRTELQGRALRIVATERTDGDLHPTRTPSGELADRELALTGAHWAMADQVHRCDVWSVPPDALIGGPCLGPSADVVVVDPRIASPSPGSVPPAVAMWSADCATALFVTVGGSVVGVHAGWRGLAAGVLDLALDVAADAGGVSSAVLGPMIGPCCYEFGEVELTAVATGTGLPPATITGQTRDGKRALDVPHTVAATLERRGVVADAAAPGCTGCSGRWWSHRAGRDPQRQALVGVWAASWET